VSGLSSVNTAAFTDGELTGLAYDLEVIEIDTYLDNEGHPRLVLYYGGLGRNPLDLSAAPAGSGGRLEIWADSSPEQASEALLFNPDLSDLPGGTGAGAPDGTGDEIAPWYWDEFGGPSAEDAFPYVNDVGAYEDGFGAGAGSGLWLQAYFTPIGTTPGGLDYIKKEDLDLIDGEGDLADMDLMIVGGYAFDQGYFGTTPVVGAKLRFPQAPGTGTNVYEGSPMDAGNWQVRSHDPLELVLTAGTTDFNIAGTNYSGFTAGETVEIQFRDASTLYTIPEPATTSLLGLGLLSLVGGAVRRRIRRRK
jgi:hypothetical protein